jgi:hypothetical protein
MDPAAVNRLFFYDKAFIRNESLLDEPFDHYPADQPVKLLFLYRDMAGVYPSHRFRFVRRIVQETAAPFGDPRVLCAAYHQKRARRDVSHVFERVDR